MSEKTNESKRHDELKGFHSIVVVKFYDFVEIHYEDGVERYIGESGIGPWNQLVKEFPDIRLRPLFTSLKPDEIQKLVARAIELDPTYRPPNFFTYFYIDAPPETNLEALAKVLMTWPAIETVYVDRPGPDPVVNAADDPRWPNQGYLDMAPDGIDAEYAWGFAGGDGAGQGLIDLERGWTFNHEDLTAHGITLLHGTILNSSRAHGTAVLGEICAVDNTVGCVGICPNVSSVDVVSFNGSTRPNAILTAIANLSFGDVLLLEAQVWVSATMLGPIEAYDADFEAVRLATALGIVVVEAGGNGTNNGFAPALNLDTYTNTAGLQILNRDPANPDFRDSGAIIVTAATSAAPHTRLAYAPHGHRIDCYAWGENIDTCGSNAGTATTPPATNIYRTNFAGTSGASPIIAGAAMVVQGIAEDPANLGYRFSPRQLRVILSDPTTGTPPAPTEATEIGVMPNLRAIIDDILVLNAAVDVYIRDFAGDTGDPHTGAISASPDIILLPSKVANPQASFGQGSGTENTSTLGYEATAGQPNYLYVRVRNRGGSPATNVDARVFWSPVSTLVTPDLWTLVGSVTIPNVPTGDQLTVSDAITWPLAAIPATGHYCFVGLVGNEQDPVPDPADFLNWDNFYRFIRENNNVTWRNFNVVGNEPDPEAGDPPDFVALPFLAAGAPDKARPMQLEIASRLPKGSRVFLELPFYLIDAMQERSPYLKIVEKRRTAWLPVNPHGRRILGEALFPAKARIQLRLLVHVPKKLRANEYEVFVRQLYKGEEVGRVTWRLSPPKGRKKRIKASK